MKKILFALSLSALLTSGVYAQTPLGDLTGTGVVGYESRYVFRGKKLADASLQPKAEIGLQPFSLPNVNIYAGAWSNQPVSRRTNGASPDQRNEVDLYGGLYYNTPFKVAVDVGGTYYWYPEAGGTSLPTAFGPSMSRTYEAYIGFIGDTSPYLWNLNFNPAVYYYHDFILQQDVIEVSAKLTWDLTNIVGFSGLSLEPRIYAGIVQAKKAYGDQYIPPAAPASQDNWTNGYDYFGGSIDLNYMISPYCYIYGNVNYAYNSDGKRGGPAVIGGDPQYGGKTSNVWFGAGLKFRK